MSQKNQNNNQKSGNPQNDSDKFMIKVLVITAVISGTTFGVHQCSHDGTSSEMEVNQELIDNVIDHSDEIFHESEQKK